MSEKDVPDAPQKLCKAPLVVGPDHAKDLFDPSDGDVFVSPETAYRCEGGEWVDLDVDTDWIIETIMAYHYPNNV